METRSMATLQTSNLINLSPWIIIENINWFSDLLEVAGLGLWVFDGNGATMHINRQTSAMLGYTFDEMISLPISTFGDQEALAQAFSLRLRCKQGISETKEFKLRHRNGSSVNVMLSATPVFDKAGKYCGVVTLLMDITGKKGVEDALRKSEEKYCAILENISDGYYECDLNGNVIFANDSFARMYGFECRNEIVGRNYHDYSDSEYAEKLYRTCRKIFRTGQPCPLFYYELTDRHGNRRWASISISPIRDAHNKISGFSGITRDVTEMMRSREELRLSQESFAKAFEASPCGMALITYPEGRIELINERLAEQIGYRPDEVIGRKFTELSYWENREERIEIVRRLEAHGFVRDLETKIRRKNGEIRDRLLSIELIKVNGKRYCLSASTDITVRKRVEQDLERSREQLRALSSHIESVREAERKRIAREIHDELGQLLTGIKIDISWVDKHVAKSIDAELREKLGPRIDDIEGLLENTIQTVRDIAAKLRPGVLDDLGLIAAIKWQAEDFGKRTGIKVALKLCGEQRNLSPDLATALFRIFQEILTNVMRYACAKNVAVELSASDGELRLTVTDDGIGIAPDKINDPKSLGLLGMRERALSFNGSVEIKGWPEEGTQITVRIPIK